MQREREGKKGKSKSKERVPPVTEHTALYVKRVWYSDEKQ
jgi:hypothetical protein